MRCSTGLPYYSVGDDGALIINTTNNAGAGGIGSVQEDETGAETTASQETGTDTDTGTETGTETTEPAVTDPALDNPENAETVNSLLQGRGPGHGDCLRRRSVGG